MRLVPLGCNSTFTETSLLSSIDEYDDDAKICRFLAHKTYKSCCLMQLVNIWGVSQQQQNYFLTVKQQKLLLAKNRYQQNGKCLETGK